MNELGRSATDIDDLSEIELEGPNQLFHDLFEIVSLKFCSLINTFILVCGPRSPFTGWSLPLRAFQAALAALLSQLLPPLHFRRAFAETFRHIERVHEATLFLRFDCRRRTLDVFCVCVLRTGHVWLTQPIFAVASCAESANRAGVIRIVF